MHFLFLSLSLIALLSFPTNSLHSWASWASEIRPNICPTSIGLRGIRGVGMRSTPCEWFSTHQSWIIRRMLWLGTRSRVRKTCLVMGQVMLPASSHFSMLSRS
uniref:Secreted protein n=1 Tax=Opuntia streptacantha TaxID=393608 RepID=A0A7C8YIX5_OPUST